MSLLSTIESIRELLQQGSFFNEASVSQGILLPVLRELDWPVFDTRIVIPQFPLEGRRVDYALCNIKDKPIVFIEVKKIGQAEGADKQLFEYAFHKGIPLAVLTDGREWHFYLPSGEGDYSERRIYKLDIIEREPKDSVHYLERYLNHDEIKSGKALQSAKEDYQNISNKRRIKETLPIAWRRLLEEKDEILLELFADKAEDLCGYKPDLDLCSSFISDTINKMPIVAKFKTPSAKKPYKTVPGVVKVVPSKNDVIPGNSYTLNQLANMMLAGSKPVKLRINNLEMPTRNWSDLSVKFVGWLIDNNHLKPHNLPIYNAAARDKYFINNKPEHQNPNKDGSWREIKGFFVDVKYNTKKHVKNVLATLQNLQIENLTVEIFF